MDTKPIENRVRVKYLGYQNKINEKYLVPHF